MARMNINQRQRNNKYKIYCSALTALSMDDGTRIKSRTTRLIRRLIRDFNFRNSSYQYTFELWPSVERGAEKNIFPYTDNADIIFNSSLLYELCVYKNPLTELFMDAEGDTGLDEVARSVVGRVDFRVDGNAVAKRFLSLIELCDAFRCHLVTLSPSRRRQ